MRYLAALLLFSFSVISYGNDENILIKERNVQIFTALEGLNSLYSVNPPSLSAERRADISQIVSKFDDPFELARLMVLCNYLSEPISSDSSIGTIFNSVTEYYGMKRLKALKSHPNFLKAMLFIQNSIRLDACVSEQFTELLWDARDVSGVKKSFPKRIEQWEESLRRYGPK